MARRKTIPDTAETAFTTFSGTGKTGEEMKEGGGADRVSKGEKSRLTVDVSGEVADAARSAVYWTAGLTLAGLVESGIRYEVERLEKERGEGFPSRPGDSGLKRGRPVR